MTGARGATFAGAVIAIAAAALAVWAPAGAQQNADMQGLWKNAESTVRITVKNGDVRAQFVEIGAIARDLGFKPGELSLSATQRGPFLIGEQTVRYAGNPACYKEGRKVPAMGRMSPDGRVLALHNYTLVIGPDCRDTGQYTITETLWQRAAR